MGWDEISESVCDVAQALAVVGDRWTLLIMRELGMGTHRFEELQAQTGMSSHLLSTRLKRMEEDGLLERKLYSSRPARYEYHATRKGKELDAVLLALRGWTMRWRADEPDAAPAVTLVHRASGETIGPTWQAPPGDHPFTFDDVDATIGPAFKAEREARSADFQEGKPRAKKPGR